MSSTEFRILTEIAAITAAILPVGLLAHAWRKRKVSQSPVLLSSVGSCEATPILIAEGPEPGGEAALTVSPPPLSQTQWKPGKGELVVGVVLSLLLLLVSFGGKAIEISHPDSDKTSSAPVSAGMLLINLVVMHGMQIGIVAVWFFTARHTSLVKVFDLKKYRAPRAAGMAVLLLIPAAIVAMLAMALVTMQLRNIGWPMEEQDAVRLLKTSGDSATVAVLMFGACIGAPIAEELIFRGMIYAPLRNITDKWFAMLFSALWFGIIHANLPSFIPLSCLGFFFALAYELTGSLTISILMHMMFNTVMILFTL